MNAVVLCAGFATRMYPLTQKFPKTRQATLSITYAGGNGCPLSDPPADDWISAVSKLTGMPTAICGKALATNVGLKEFNVKNENKGVAH